MAKKIVLKDRETQEVEYPITTTDCVLCSDGQTIKEKYATKQYTQETCSDFVNSTPERLAVIDELGEKLANDSNAATAVVNTIGDAKKELFIDMWNTAFGEYGKYDPENAPDKSKPFYGNELWLSYEEALAVDYYSGHLGGTFTGDTLTASFGEYVQCKTLYPFRLQTAGAKHNLNFYGTLGSVETIRFVNYRPQPSFLGAYNARSIKKILGEIDVSFLKDFNPIPSSPVTTFSFNRLNSNLNISQWRYASYESLHYLIDNAINTAPITITVHPDIYAALIGSASYPFNGGTQEEWEQLLLTAQNRQITFST